MEFLYSRQIGVLGKHAMKHISNLNVVIMGCDTIGVETAKSLALMGIKSMYLFDNTKYSQEHYGRLLNKGGETSKLSILCKQFIDSLQTSCVTQVITTTNSIKTFLKKQTVECVVMCDSNYDIVGIEKLCMKYKKPFIFGCNNELLGYVFSNFGNWDIYDNNGEICFKQHITKSIINKDFIELLFESNEMPISKNFTLSTQTATYEGVVDSYKVVTNGVKKNLVAKIAANKDLIEFLNNCNVLFTETKKLIQVKHTNFKKHISKLNYQYIDTDISFNRNDELYTNYTKYLLTKKTSYYSSEFTDKKHLRFYVIGTIIGGILSQEVIKTCHKYTPIDQDLIFNFRKLYGKNFYKSMNKYTDVCGLLDKEVFQKIKKINAFMIGCGALGCEISKNLGMLGFCQLKKAQFTMTDMDTIELSNLTRQFLFQPNNIGKNKSYIVKSKLNKYCPDMNTTSYTQRVGKDNAKIFNSNFWENKDIVINALDNIEARQYVDNRCIIFKKPLFESGTLGVKGNVQVIIPNKTATYSEITDPPEKNIPMCTIRNFPNNIEHCVEWGVNIFSKVFNDGLSDLNKFKHNRTGLIDEINKLDADTNKTERYTTLYYLINYFNTKSTSALMKLGNHIYNYYYYNVITDLLQTHDENSFWTGNKLKPKVIPHKKILNKKYYLSILELIDNENHNIKKLLFRITKKTTMTRRIDSLNGINLKKISLPESINYDKDLINHLDIMTNLVNIRARCYNIKESDNVNIQLLSGKIIPALSTTTSIISGFAVLDIIKYLAGDTAFSETNINIGINQYTRYKAFNPKVTHNNMFSNDYGIKIKTIPRHFNTWDRIAINGKKNMIQTNIELVEYLKDTYELENIDMLVSDTFVIYSQQVNKEIKLKKLYNFISKDKNYKIGVKEPVLIDMICFDVDYIPILTPPILFRLM